MRRRTLGSTEVFTYTVNYNVEGAIVYANGENVGVISNGTLTFSRKGNDAPDNYDITFSGTLPSKDPQYTFNVSPTTLSFTAAGGTQSVSVTSTVTTYTQSHSSGTVLKNNSLTLTYNETSSSANVGFGSASNTGNITISGTNITFASNPTHDTRSGIVTFVQNTSSNSAQVTCNQAALTTYNYTVYSNCEGGTVYFNNVNKGTISGGVRSFTDESTSGTVRISGGVPSNTTREVYSHNEQQEESDTQQVAQVSQNQSSFSFTAKAQSQQFDSVFTDQTDNQVRTRVKSRSVYDVYTTTYTGPSNKTAYGDSSVTMNYTSSESLTGTDYSSWNYGSWSSWESTGAASGYPSLSVTSGSDWLTVVRKNSSGNNWSPYGVYITVEKNTSTSSRTGKFTMKSGANGRTYTFTVTQAALTYAFSISGSFNNHQASASTDYSTASSHVGTIKLTSYSYDGSTYTRESFTAAVSPTDYINSVYSSATGSGSSTGYNIAVGMKEYSNLSKGTSYNRRTLKVTLYQSGSNKSVTFSIDQRSYRLYVYTNQNGYKGTGEDQSYDIVYNTVNGGYTWYAQCDDGFTNIPAYITNSNSAWYLVEVNSNGNSSRTAITTETEERAFQINADTNTSTSSRKTTATVYISGKTSLGNIKINITQEGKADAYVFSASPSSTMLAPTSGSSSSILVTSTYNGASQSWSISGTTGSWVSASKSGNYLNIRATSANTASVSRLGNVQIKQSGSNKTISISVQQAAKIN